MKHHEHTYDELARVAQRYYDDSGFCTVIALAVSARIAFGKARAIWKKCGRQHRKGTLPWQQEIAFKMAGLRLEPMPADYLGKTFTSVGTNAAGLKGTYLVYSRSHVAAIKEGVVMDWTRKGSTKRIVTCYKVLPL